MTGMARRGREKLQKCGTGRNFAWGHENGNCQCLGKRTGGWSGNSNKESKGRAISPPALVFKMTKKKKKQENPTNQPKQTTTTKTKTKAKPQSGDYQRKGGGGRVEEGNGGVNGDGRRLDLGWWAHNALYRWCIIELYTWNLYNFLTNVTTINSIK